MRCAHIPSSDWEKKNKWNLNKSSESSCLILTISRIFKFLFLYLLISLEYLNTFLFVRSVFFLKFLNEKLISRTTWNERKELREWLHGPLFSTVLSKINMYIVCLLFSDFLWCHNWITIEPRRVWNNRRIQLCRIVNPVSVGLFFQVENGCPKNPGLFSLKKTKCKCYYFHIEGLI